MEGRGGGSGNCFPWAPTQRQGQRWAQGKEGEPCLVGKVGLSADLCHLGYSVPGAGAQNQGRWQVRSTEATGQGHWLVSGSAGLKWWPGRRGASSEGDRSAASP